MAFVGSGSGVFAALRGEQVEVFGQRPEQLSEPSLARRARIRL